MVNYGKLIVAGTGAFVKAAYNLYKRKEISLEQYAGVLRRANASCLNNKGGGNFGINEIIIRGNTETNGVTA